MQKIVWMIATILLIIVLLMYCSDTARDDSDLQPCIINDVQYCAPTNSALEKP